MGCSVQTTSKSMVTQARAYPQCLWNTKGLGPPDCYGTHQEWLWWSSPWGCRVMAHFVLFCTLVLQYVLIKHFKNTVLQMQSWLFKTYDFSLVFLKYVIQSHLSSGARHQGDEHPHTHQRTTQCLSTYPISLFCCCTISILCSLQFLMACGNKLVTPTLQEGQDLNGMLIHKVYKTKTLYVRPSRTLLVSVSGIFGLFLV